MTKNQLRAYRDIKREREQLKLKIEGLEAELYSPGTQRLDGMPRGGSGGDRDWREDTIELKEKLLQQYKDKEVELSAAALAIEEAIESLEPRERTIMRLYYIDGLTWEQVAVKMSYSWRQVHRIHGKALALLKESK